MLAIWTDCLDRDCGGLMHAQEEVVVAAAPQRKRGRPFWKNSTRSPPLALLAPLRLYLGYLKALLRLY